MAVASGHAWWGSAGWRPGQQVGQLDAGVIELIEPTADSLTEDLNAKVRLQPGALAGAGFSPLLGVWQVGRNGLVFAPLQLGRQDGSGAVLFS